MLLKNVGIKEEILYVNIYQKQIFEELIMYIVSKRNIRHCEALKRLCKFFASVFYIRVNKKFKKCEKNAWKSC